MDEEVARETLTSDYNVPHETLDRFGRFLDFLKEENERHNLVSRRSLMEAWSRHILDSAQLVRFAPDPESSWLDLGTGAGFPGLIVAVLHPGVVTLVEERRLRVDFLMRAAEILGLSGKYEIHQRRAESLDIGQFGVISARAFAPLDRLLTIGSRFSTLSTGWILPKGRNAQSELDAARASWQGEYRIEPSITDPEAGIIVASGVRKKAGGKIR
jgi:16S rRNA (guanine527-N7)-methyltransferase